MQKLLCENLKRLRMAKNMTQEQVAETLSVNPQTVSRWECGTTLPDVLTLPLLAKLYGVTVDDFYRKNTVAYDNYAQRLAAVYEKTRDPADFLQALGEFKKMMREKELSVADEWNVAMLYYFMLKHCKEKAMEWFDRIVENGPGDDLHSYYRACSCRISLYFAIGKGDEIIAMQNEYLQKNKNDPRAWQLYIETLIYAEDFVQAYDCFNDATRLFSEDWILYILGGDICAKLKKYDEAMRYYDKAGQIGTCFCDEKYCKACLYEDLGEIEKAAQEYMEIAQILQSRGFDVEAEMAQQEADRLMKKES
ncbi:MAG: helix-turn-helix domain-containing protein [Clostridia bacterium]|nr:helix-turn-helix domain-containing protein [Clostridia bacterium]